MQRIAELVQQVVNMPGTSIENNGQVILAGTIPGTKPVQYRYEFFKPLTDEEIKSVSDSSRRPFPKQLAQLYKITMVQISLVVLFVLTVYQHGERTTSNLVLLSLKMVIGQCFVQNPGFSLPPTILSHRFRFFLIQKNLKMQCVCMQQDMAATKSLQSGHLSKSGCTANIKNTWTNFKMETIN